MSPNKVAALPDVIADVQAEQSRAQLAIAEAQEQQGKPFNHGQQLVDARRRVETVNPRMNQTSGIDGAITDGSASTLTQGPRATEQALAAIRSPFTATTSPQRNGPAPGR